MVDISSDIYSNMVFYYYLKIYIKVKRSIDFLADFYLNLTFGVSLIGSLYPLGTSFS